MTDGSIPAIPEESAGRTQPSTPAPSLEAAPATEVETDPHRRSPKSAGSAALDMELIISRLLQVGVYTSSAVILAGLVLMVLTRSTGYSSVGAYHLQNLLKYHSHRAAEFPVSLSEVAAGTLAHKPFAIIMLGVLLLIATPVLRVAVSLVAFILERDRAYTWITLYVLVVLIVSFLIGRAIG